MFSELLPGSPTDRHSTFNDEVNQNYMLYIPANQPVITAGLDWTGRNPRRQKRFPLGNTESIFLPWN
ncbi:MAG: hypothetical protein ABI162_04005 [Luteolibacter sp.]